MSTLAAQWHVALMSSSSTSGSGGLDVSATDYPPYAGTSTITAPTSNPSTGDRFGANGYQSGIDIGSDNYYMSGGLDVPTERTEKRIRLGHTDHSTYVFGQDFYGYVDASYAV
jgi:hypothetical protein